MNIAILHALAAALFGASTPLAKSLVGDLPPLLLAGLLYLGSGLGLTIARLIRDRRWQPSGFTRAEWPWFLGAVFFGGIRFVSFVMAVCGLGTTRTGAYFSTVPFIGAAVAIAYFAATPSPAFWIAAGLMALGVWLHLTVSHGHEHAHEPLDHTHDHDEHHQHAHHFPWNGTEPHGHPHRRVQHKHSHAHFPDTHHRHPH